MIEFGCNTVLRKDRIKGQMLLFISRAYPFANSRSYLADDSDFRHGWNFLDPLVDETAIRE